MLKEVPQVLNCVVILPGQVDPTDMTEINGGILSIKIRWRDELEDLPEHLESFVDGILIMDKPTIVTPEQAG